MPIKFCPETYFSCFNEPEISDSEPMAYRPSQKTSAQDFYILKNPSTSAGFEPANLGPKGEYITPRPPRQLIATLYFGFTLNYNLNEIKQQ